jgi:hypothetical protein
LGRSDPFIPRAPRLAQAVVHPLALLDEELISIGSPDLAFATGTLGVACRDEE